MPKVCSGYAGESHVQIFLDVVRTDFLLNCVKRANKIESLKKGFSH